MKLPGAVVYRGGAKGKGRCLKRKNYEFSAESSSEDVLDLRFTTNPGGKRQSGFCIGFSEDSCVALLKYIVQRLGSVERLEAVVAEIRNGKAGK